MNKFFYIFYLYPFFISISLFAQEISRPAKQKDIEKQPLLTNLDDDDLGAAPAAYHTEPLSPQTTDHTSQQSSPSKQALPRYLSQEKTGLQTQPVMVGKTNSKGFAKLTEDDDGDFDPRSTSNQQVTPPPGQLFEPSVDYAQYTATNHATQGDLYPPLEQVAAPQPVVQQQEPVVYGQPISTSRTVQVAPPAAQPSAPSVDSSPYNTSSRPLRFNPFEVPPQEQIIVTQPVAQQQGPEAAWRTAQVASYAAQQASTSSTSQQQSAPLAAQSLLPPEYAKSIAQDESIKIKKQAHAALIVLLDTLYIRNEDDEVCTNIRKGLMVQITRLRKLLPHESNIDKWYLNLPIDVDGHSMAHLAAANLDPKFLQMVHMMGVDIFRSNNFNTSPEDTAGRYLIEKTNLTPAQKKLLLPEAADQENSGKRRVRKPSIVSTATSSTSVEEQKKQKKYDEKKRQDERESYQKCQKAFLERHKKIIDYFDRVKNKKK